jgi:hypothetical protein
MMKSIVTILILTLLIAVPSMSRADAREDFRRQIEQQKKTQEMYAARYEMLPGKKKINDLLKITTEANNLVVKSPLFDGDAAVKLPKPQMRVEVEGFEGFCTLGVQATGNGSFYFSLSHVSYPNLDGVSNFSISMQQGYLAMTRNVSSQAKSYTVNLQQCQGRMMFGQADGIQLSVYGSDNNGPMNSSVNISEPDFTTLRRKHPREVDQHLRPMMRELKLESLFTVDPMIAWQVFNDEWKDNQSVAKQIKALLPQLELDGYPQRQAASKAIRDLGPDAALVIYRMDRAGLSPEQNSQLDVLLSAHSFLSRREATRLLTDVDFLLDCMYSDDSQVRASAARHLKQTVKREVTFDPKDDYEVRVARVEALRGELTARAPSTTQAVKG